MIYTETVKGIFIKRINRFIADVFVDGQLEKVHVKNTGRLKELLLEGKEVILNKANHLNRKTKYSLIAVRKGERWVNIDSQAPNRVVYEALGEGMIAELGYPLKRKREVTFGKSRFDIFFEDEGEKGFIEVKGVTLEQNGIAMFPDAPTDRGTKHILEMIEAVKAGYRGVIFFLVQMKGCQAFTPNEDMDKNFAEACRNAVENGVEFLSYDCLVTEEELVIDQPIHITI